jgi:hypothetical protein
MLRYIGSRNAAPPPFLSQRPFPYLPIPHFLNGPRPRFHSFSPPRARPPRARACANTAQPRHATPVESPKHPASTRSRPPRHRAGGRRLGYAAVRVGGPVQAAPRAPDVQGRLPLLPPRPPRAPLRVLLGDHHHARVLLLGGDHVPVLLRRLVPAAPVPRRALRGRQLRPRRRCRVLLRRRRRLLPAAHADLRQQEAAAREPGRAGQGEGRGEEEEERQEEEDREVPVQARWRGEAAAHRRRRRRRRRRRALPLQNHEGEDGVQMGVLLNPLVRSDASTMLHTHARLRAGFLDRSVWSFFPPLQVLLCFNPLQLVSMVSLSDCVHETSQNYGSL